MNRYTDRQMNNNKSVIKNYW